MASEDLKHVSLSRRCTSEPPFLGNRHFSTIAQRTAHSSSFSLSEVSSPEPRAQEQKLNMSTSIGRPVNRSNTFPFLPALTNSLNKPHQLKPINNIKQENGSSFKNNVFHNQEKILSPCQEGFEGRKFQLRSRYVDTKEIAPAKNTTLFRYPLEQRVQESEGYEQNETGIRNKVVVDPEIKPERPCQANYRRLSIITEKSTFSKPSRTLLLDLEDGNGIPKSSLPSVDVGKEGKRRTVEKNSNYCDKNSKKLQEHLQRAGKQFDPSETRAALLSNWFNTLQTG